MAVVWRLPFAPTMLAASATPEQSKTLAFRDGLGDRFVSSDNATGAPVQILRLRSDMTEVPAFEFALRERTARLSTFRQDAYARVYRVHRMPAPARELVMVSEHVEGLRLSALLRVAEQHRVAIDLAAALSVIRQLLQATTLLHAHGPDLANGLIAPERVIVTPRARVTVAEQALCAAIEQLHYTRERLWRELRIAAASGPARFTHRTDVMSIGLVALALVLGRPLRDEDFPDALPALLDAAREHSALGYERPLSPPLRDWLASALQLDPGRSFASASDAWRAFERVVEADPLYLSVPMALERFLYSCTAALIQHPAGLPEAEPLPAAAPPGRVSTPEQFLTSPALPLAPVVSEPEIRVEMLPPPSIDGPAQGASDVQGDPIDWSSLADRSSAVVTSTDITQLFSEVGTSTAAGVVAEPERAPVPTRDAMARPAPTQPPVASVPAAVTSAPPPPRQEPEPDIPALSRATFPLGPATAVATSPTWRRMVIAAGLVGLLAGGVALNHFMRPAVVAASEMGTVIVDTDPAGVQILIDGTEQGRTPARLTVPAGDHILELRGAGAPRLLPIKVAGGAEVSHYIEFGNEPTPDASAVDAPVEPAAPTAAAPPAVAVAPAPVNSAPTWGWLDVKSALPVEVRIDGRVLGRSDGERVRLAEGRHQIELVNADAGYRAVRVVHVAGGKVTNLAMPTPANGIVNINAAPWAEVWIGSRRVGETPLANISVPLGRHEVVFRHPELGEKRQSISVTGGSPVRITVDMK
jgi:hypothetical protein